MAKDLVKQDINFLENPLWFQDEKLANRTEDGFVWKDKEGFIYRAGYKPPVKTDMIFLLYLLIQSQKQKWAETLTLSRYQVMNDCGLGTNDWWYDRLEDSLKRWKMVGIEFHGMFYDKKEYLTKMFGIIDEWEVDKETKLLTVKLSSSYLLKIRESAFFRYIDFEQIKASRSPLATRLYEILMKSFKKSDTWKIDAVLLARKIPMKEKYPAHIVVKIKPAINRISTNTDLKVKFEIDKQKRGKVILVFTKLPTEKKTKKPVATGKTAFIVPDDAEFKNLVSLLPWERQKQTTLLEVLWKAFRRHGSDYVAWNIKYANKRAIGNYPAYLVKALKNDYGKAMKEDAEAQKQVESERAEATKEREQEISEAQAKEERDIERAKTYLKDLSEMEALEIEAEAFKKLPGFLQRSFKREEKDKNVSFQATLRLLALKRLDAVASPEPHVQPLLALETAE
ncbi:MAG: hypothetical protein ACD_13C00042G0005 [uncultured bacterium]|nr:MAG: hypothetical protein ACD_13C00042G0005 [uncultured bacterium]